MLQEDAILHSEDVSCAWHCKIAFLLGKGGEGLGEWGLNTRPEP